MECWLNVAKFHSGTNSWRGCSEGCGSLITETQTSEAMWDTYPTARECPQSSHSVCCDRLWAWRVFRIDQKPQRNTSLKCYLRPKGTGILPWSCQKKSAYRSAANISSSKLCRQRCVRCEGQGPQQNWMVVAQGRAGAVKARRGTSTWARDFDGN